MKHPATAHVVFLLAFLLALGCAPALVQFHDANFGVHFSHPKKFSTAYNPHGGADRVTILHAGQPLGALLIRPAPDATTDQFIAAGKDYFRRNFGATEVDYTVITTPGGYPFHHLKANGLIEGAPSVIERYVYLRPKTVQIGKSSSAEEISQAVIESYAGAFSFEFVYPAADYERLKPDARTVVDTFTLAKK